MDLGFATLPRWGASIRTDTGQQLPLFIRKVPFSGRYLNVVKYLQLQPF